MRFVTLAISAITLLSFGLVSWQMQVDRTSSQINATGNTGTAFNMTKEILPDVTTSLGIAVPGFFLAGLVAFIIVLLAVVLR